MNRLPGNPHLPPGVRQSDLDGPAMTEAQREQARREAEDRAYDDWKDQQSLNSKKKDQ